ncbi:MAG: hypothetical protein K2Y22_04115 [Candidatus Obscuribacterales bacterium]|nr:hypothetical protein [Candidatus Obscuribacterales bacterium]
MKKTQQTKKNSSANEEFWFDQEAADRVIKFFCRFLKHTDDEWAGKPFKPLQWQEDLLRELFGWKRADGTRRYRTLYLEIPRKNGKSTLAAAIAVYLLFCDAPVRGQIISAAADTDQAKIIFDTAKAMIEASPKLKKRCWIFKKYIKVKKTGAIYKVVSADARTKHGTKPHGILFDELHVQKTRSLYDALRTGRGTLKQPLEILLTTAGENPDSLCGNIHDYAINVRDGVFPDSTFLPKIFAAEKTDDWKDPKVWLKANPNLGSAISFESLRDECDMAQRMPSYENTFKQLYLNIWTESMDVFIPEAFWIRAGRDLVLEDFEGRKCWAALDLSKRIDPTALALCFPDDDFNKFFNFNKFWIPADLLEYHEKTDHVPYKLWAKDPKANLILTPGDIVDYTYIEEDLLKLMERFHMMELAFDPWRSEQFRTRLINNEGIPAVEFRQGTRSMSGPMMDYEAMVISRQFQHDSNPMMKWMMRNLLAYRDSSGNIKPDKSKKNRRIDGPVASIMALARALEHKDDDSIYNTRGLIVL